MELLTLIGVLLIVATNVQRNLILKNQSTVINVPVPSVEVIVEEPHPHIEVQAADFDYERLESIITRIVGARETQIPLPTYPVIPMPSYPEPQYPSYPIISEMNTVTNDTEMNGIEVRQFPAR